MAQLNIEEISHRMFRLRKDGAVVGVVRPSPGFVVKKGRDTQTGEKVFVLKEGPSEVEVIAEIVRRPNVKMPQAGIFDEDGVRIGDASPFWFGQAPKDFFRS